MLIKVCGLKYADNLLNVSKLKPNLLGFVCFSESKRYVDLATLESLIPILSEINASKVMVCVNPSISFIEDYFKIFKFDYIQLHGNESVDFCMELKEKFSVKIIKAFSVDDSFDFSVCANYEKVSDLFIFDTKCEVYGGSGKVFNWDVLENYNLSRDYLLSGGLNLENIELAFKHVKSKKTSIGLDVNSGFEVEPGVKDIEKLKVLFNKKESYGF